MPILSNNSIEKLRSCHPDLKVLFNQVVLFRECKVLCGHRDKVGQDIAFWAGASKLKYPKSKHNQWPSLAVDVAPVIGGKISFDQNQCYEFGGFVKGIAAVKNINVRWGGDWDQDFNVNDQKFNDLLHFELV